MGKIQTGTKFATAWVNRYGVKQHKPLFPENYFLLRLKKYRKEPGYIRVASDEMLKVNSSANYRFDLSKNRKIKCCVRNCYVVCTWILTIVCECKKAFRHFIGDGTLSLNQAQI
ncbi:hypothetical protein [Phocaeicola sartorii]|uniref:hypothetical protein n=1 Tax=Phocaeicola sartorii TaxID=671267 RepID=UPI00242E47BA|nr:hypothetical protein [Phocaeicola sartorii]